MYQQNKQDDDEHDQKTREYIRSKPWENDYRILKKTLNEELYDKAKTRRTPCGASLWDCIKSGIIMDDSKMGAYACDKESYDVFEDVFEPMILSYFKTKKYHCGKDFGDLSKKENRDRLDLAAVDTNNLICSTRVRVARNLDDFPYAAKITKEQRLAVQAKVEEAVKGFEGDLKGKYTRMEELSEEEQAQQVNDHLLFHNRDAYIKEAGMFMDWPSGRGAYHSDNKDKRTMIWCNEEDHMRVICLENGSDLLGVYTRLIKTLQCLDKTMTMAEHPKWGFLASCPTNVGTGMRASVHIKIPLTSGLPCFKDLCSDMDMDIRGVHGEHSESADGTFDISNRDRYGLSEFAAISTMAKGVKNLVRIENALMEYKKKLDELEGKK